MLAFIVAVVLFLVIWGLTLTVPGLQLIGKDALFVPLGVPILLLPWLLPPLALLDAVLHRGLWKVIQYSGTSDSQATIETRPGRLTAAERERLPSVH